MGKDDIESLRSEWSKLYAQTLPKLARAKDAAQPKWPVTLDHCFARIILDNTVGGGTQQWDQVIERPAVKNMTLSQLQEAIKLGEQIQKGKADLVALDQKSLEVRGKAEQKYKDTANNKRSRDNSDCVESKVQPSLKRVKSQKQQSIISFTKSSSTKDQHQETSQDSTSPSGSGSIAKKSFPNPNTAEFLAKIRNHTGLTPYRKRLYSTLLSVPPGTYTTYQAMATYLESSARAVGNGMRNNPYAPDVPCHRVLASDGSIGGFYGSWGEEGKHAGKKRDLLNSEGVYFDSRGRVKGPVFHDFEDFSLRRDP